MPRVQTVGASPQRESMPCCERGVAILAALSETRDWSVVLVRSSVPSLGWTRWRAAVQRAHLGPPSRGNQFKMLLTGPRDLLLLSQCTFFFWGTNG